MKFFTTAQIRQLDRYTIEHEPISSINLMERAADALYWKYLQAFPYQNRFTSLPDRGTTAATRWL